MDPGERSYGPKECGSCRLWRPILEDGRGPIGPCMLKVRTGDFPGTAPACERYLSRDAAVPSAAPAEPARRRAARPLRPVVHRAGSAAEAEAFDAAPGSARGRAGRPPRPRGARRRGATPSRGADRHDP